MYHQEELTEIYIHLKDVLRDLSRTPIDEEFQEMTLADDMFKLREVMKDSIVDEQSSTLLYKINEIAETLSQMLNLRFNLRCKYINQDGIIPLDKLQPNPNELKTPNVNPQEIFKKTPISEPNIDTSLVETNTIDDSEDSSHVESTKLTRRLPKKTLDLLNEWYKENVENPYLTRDDITMLKSRTSLSENQIKNWASNKRRKRKETQISQEVSELLRPI